jgi:hypothetical protein
MMLNHWPRLSDHPASLRDRRRPLGDRRPAGVMTVNDFSSRVVEPLKEVLTENHPSWGLPQAHYPSADMTMKEGTSPQIYSLI